MPPDKTRILVVIYEYPPLGGGGGIGCKQILEEIKRKKPGCEFDVLTAGMRGLTHEEVVNGIHIYRVPSTGRKTWSHTPLISLLFFPLAGFLKGCHLARMHRYHCIYSWFALPSGILGVSLAKLFKKKHYLVLIGGDLYKPDQAWSPHRWPWFRWMVWLVAQSSDKVSTLSLDIQKKAREWFGIKKHIAVIPLGIEFIEHKKKTKDELGLDKDAQYLISVGRLIERKGYRYLLKAVSMLPARVELLIIGEGPQKSSLAKLAHELNSGPRVHFLGRLSEEGKFAYLDASDIYVMSSLHEGFGIVLLEAMYCELPLVSTACGGAEDIILENQSGLLCKAADAQDLARKIMILIEDSEKRKRYGRKGRELCNSYHIAAVSQRYIQFLEL